MGNFWLEFSLKIITSVNSPRGGNLLIAHFFKDK
jgi:hypothetical protein